MRPVIDFLSKNPIQFLATAGLDGKPKVRPFQFMFEKDGRLWFCTGTGKEVFQELQEQPYIELSACSRENEWIRLSAKVVFEDNLSVKREILERNELVRKIYQNSDNPVFAVFYLTQVKAIIADFSGNPPQTFTC